MPVYTFLYASKEFDYLIKFDRPFSFEVFATPKEVCELFEDFWLWNRPIKEYIIVEFGLDITDDKIQRTKSGRYSLTMFRDPIPITRVIYLPKPFMDLGYTLVRKEGRKDLNSMFKFTQNCYSYQYPVWRTPEEAFAFLKSSGGKECILEVAIDWSSTFQSMTGSKYILEFTPAVPLRFFEFAKQLSKDDILFEVP